jgi:hypothetical protein
MDLSALAPILLFSVLLLLAAIGLMIWHVRAWRSSQAEQLDAGELNYRRRQFRRRMQTSAMLGLLAIALGVGHPLTILWMRGIFTLVYWAVVMLLLCWVVLLGLVDVWATKHYYGRLQQECQIAQAKLRAAARRLQTHEGNGKGDEPHPRIRETE